MIAALFRTSDGEFNTPGLALSIFFTCLGCAGFYVLPKALREGRIPYPYATPGSSPGVFIERKINSLGFWILFCVYTLGSLASLALAIVCSFGLFRKSG